MRGSIELHSARIFAAFALLAASTLFWAQPFASAGDQAVDRFTFWSLADTTVDGSAPDEALGDEPTIAIDAGRKAILAFKLEGLARRTILSAELLIYRTEGQGAARLSRTTNDWDESTTWTNRPPRRAKLAEVASTTEVGWQSIPIPAIGRGRNSFMIDRPTAGELEWSSREGNHPPMLVVGVAREPGLVVDGLSQIAHERTGSSDPTYYSNQHRLAKSRGGRLFTVHGRHAEGVQLAWRDPGGGWQTISRGVVGNGLLRGGTGTGDWPASIAIASDSEGHQHAWVVWAAPSIGASPKTVIEMRRLSQLGARNGPRVGPLIDLAVLTEPSDVVGSARVDLAIESAQGGVRRGVITWLSARGSTNDLMTGWLNDLDTDEPQLTDRTALFSASAARGATIESARGETSLVVRNAGGDLQVFQRDASDAPGQWSPLEAGLPLAPDLAGFPSATILDSGDTVAVVETDTSEHEIAVQRWRASTGQALKPRILAGYAEPTIASDGRRAWIVAVRTDDGDVVTRQVVGPGVSVAEDIVEIPTEHAPAASFPNALRRDRHRVRFVLKGRSSGTSRSNVFAFQREW